jgi:hypothetical protein
MVMDCDAMWWSLGGNHLQDHMVSESRRPRSTETEYDRE